MRSFLDDAWMQCGILKGIVDNIVVENVAFLITLL